MSVLGALTAGIIPVVETEETIRQAHQEWVNAVDSAILELAVTGKPFDAEDVRSMVNRNPRHPNAWGYRFIFAQREGVIQPYGWCHSTRRSRHGSAQRLWEGC